MQTSLSSVMCQYCQTGGLKWLRVGEKWRLVYPDNRLHLCRTTRDKIAKSIHREPIGPPTLEQHLLKGLTKEGVAMILKRKPVVEEFPPEDMHDPWWDFLFQDERKAGREAAAKQMELIP